MEFTRPVLQTLHFKGVDVYAFFADDHPKVVYFVFFELTFGKSQEVGFFPEFVQNLMDDLSMSLDIIAHCD